jgi:hypothetical protein
MYAQMLQKMYASDVASFKVYLPTYTRPPPNKDVNTGADACKALSSFQTTVKTAFSLQTHLVDECNSCKDISISAPILSRKSLCKYLCPDFTGVIAHTEVPSVNSGPIESGTTL